MVTAKNVQWAESAKTDLFNIYSRIAGKSVERARGMINTILGQTATLNTEYPKGAPELMLKNEPDPYKFIFAGFYKIVYSIVGEDVVVETIYHKRQDPVV